MVIDAWLPNGYRFPDGEKARIAVYEGSGWQILEAQENGKILVASDELTRRWVTSGFFDQNSFMKFDYGEQRLWAMSCRRDEILCPLLCADSPDSKSAAVALAMALQQAREVDEDAPLQDALYVEKLGILLPTYTTEAKTDDDIVLGRWLTGGANLSVKSFAQLRRHMSWLAEDDLREVIEIAGLEFSGNGEHAQARLRKREETGKIDALADQTYDKPESQSDSRVFELPGRPELANFFNEHVIDIVQNKERYQVLGIDFPSAIVLHGPPGCGKTFAVERLVDFLGWPSFQIDASSVASAYIHETSKKVAEVFKKAIRSAPSVIVIDEMESFLADREMGIGHHRVEEVAEFLRRIPEAVKSEVLIIAMTNRIDIIDPAILRRGRFDHVIKVDHASEAEILALLEKLMSTLPRGQDVDAVPLAMELAGRPLSDVAFVVREGARLAARYGRDRLDQASLMAALHATPARAREGGTPRREKKDEGESLGNR